MKPGIFMSKGAPVGLLDKWFARYCDETGNDSSISASVVAASCHAALNEVLDTFRQAGLRPEWVCGPGVTPQAVRACRLEYRMRRPGAGRRPVDPAGRVVPLNTWVSPSARIKIEAAAHAANRSIGEEIAARFP